MYSEEGEMEESEEPTLRRHTAQGKEGLFQTQSCSVPLRRHRVVRPSEEDINDYQEVNIYLYIYIYIYIYIYAISDVCAT